MTDTTESRWFKIVVFILAAIVVGVSIANIVYFNRIRDGTCQAVSRNSATTMLWVNVILLVIAILVLLWSLWRMIFTSETREKVKHYMVAPAEGMNMGYNYQPQQYQTYNPVAVSTSTDESSMVVAPNEQSQLVQNQKYL